MAGEANGHNHVANLLICAALLATMDDLPRLEDVFSNLEEGRMVHPFVQTALIIAVDPDFHFEEDEGVRRSQEYVR